MLAFHQLIKFTCMNKLWGTKSIFFTFDISNFGRTLNSEYQHIENAADERQI